MIQTPIQKLEFPNDRGVRLYCKREGLLPFSLGGNKVRIGRAFFQDMQEKNKDCMIIYGKQQIQPPAACWPICAVPRKFHAI